MSLHLIGIKINDQSLSMIGKQRFHLDQEMDISEWDKSEDEIRKIKDAKLQQKARCLSSVPLVVYSNGEFMIEHDKNYKKLDKKQPFLALMPKLWKCNVLHLNGEFCSSQSWNIPLFHDLVLCMKLQRRVQYHFSEWMFGNESAYALQAGIIEWSKNDVNKLLNDEDAKEIAKRFGSYNWRNARIYQQYQDEVRDEMIFPEKPEFVDSDPEEEAKVDDFRELHKRMGWKGESFTDFMLKDNAESNDGEFELNEDEPGGYSALHQGEEIFELLFDRNVLELGDQSEPAPMLFVARSPTGNLICLLTATGWSCG